jgi:predicted DNA-binding transcriptional regulator AlpA
VEDEMLEGKEELLSAKEVALLLKCSPSMIYRLAHEGLLVPRFKIFPSQKGWRWTRGDVQEYVNRNAVDVLAHEPTPLFQPVYVREKSGR